MNTKLPEVKFLTLDEYAERLTDMAAWRKHVGESMCEDLIFMGYTPRKVPWYELLAYRIGNWLIRAGEKLGGQSEWNDR